MFKKILLKLKERDLNEIIRLFDLKFGLGALERIISSNWFNPLWTVYINFRSFSFNQAIRLPVFVYGRPKLFCLSGKMLVDGKVKLGMVKFNNTRPGAPSNMSVKSEINNQGTIIFRGKCLIGTGTKIFVLSHAIFEVGDDVTIADFCNIGCLKGIKIGNTVRIAHRCQILDSNYHYIADFNDYKISNYSKPISIGDYCWVCNTSTITGGAVIPDHIIISSNSLANRDYSKIPVGSLLAGIPARQIKSGVYRVFNEDIAIKISKFYSANPELLYSINEDVMPNNYYETN